MMMTDKLKSYAYAIEHGIDVDAIGEYEIQISTEDVDAVRIKLDQMKDRENVGMTTLEAELDHILKRFQVCDICTFLYFHGEYRETIAAIAHRTLGEDSLVIEDPYANDYDDET